MEVFADGGLFEAGILLLLAGVVNFTFRIRWLLVVYSAIILAAPVVFWLAPEGFLTEAARWVQLLNAVLLVILLWKIKKLLPSENLFDSDRIRRFLKRK